MYETQLASKRGAHCRKEIITHRHRMAARVGMEHSPISSRRLHRHSSFPPPPLSIFWGQTARRAIPHGGTMHLEPCRSYTDWAPHKSSVHSMRWRPRVEVSLVLFRATWIRDCRCGLLMLVTLAGSPVTAQETDAAQALRVQSKNSGGALEVLGYQVFCSCW